jgi:hypothetical protein
VMLNFARQEGWSLFHERIYYLKTTKFGLTNILVGVENYLHYLGDNVLIKIKEMLESQTYVNYYLFSRLIQQVNFRYLQFW